MNVLRPLSNLITFSAILIVVFCGMAVAGDNWRPVTPAELSQKIPTVEKDADAEYLFWEVRVDDSDAEEMSLRHYVRLKIYTERGREQFSKVDITANDSDVSIQDVSARVIKPDGTIIEVKKEDIFERTIEKLGDEKLKAKSFAVPGNEPGVIVEYRFREVHEGVPYWMNLYFQREIPVVTCSYFVRPFQGGLGLKEQQFKMPPGVKFVRDKDNYYRATVTNVPAIHVEPRMPPINEIRSWVMIFYNTDDEITAESYWKSRNKGWAESGKDDLKANDNVKRVTAEITAGAATPEERLAKIYEYCQTQINNVDYDRNLSKEARNKVKDSKNAGETVSRKLGHSSDVDQLFGAMSTAAGFETHVAVTGFRSNLFFDRTMANRHLIHIAAIAVKVGEEWRFFSPGAQFVPFGMLAWIEDGQDTLIINSEAPIWVKIPRSLPDKSQEKRTGKFRLLEDGTLEGDVRLEYTGQLGYLRKLNNYDDSVPEQEKSLTDEVKAAMSTAELSNIHIENASDPVKPFAYSFHLRVPGYAQKTGKRLFLQPGFFEHGEGPLFTAAERKYDLYFHFSWSEEDNILIDLPAGYSLENAEQPAPITPEMTGGIALHNVRMGLSKDGKTLMYRRSFFFGGKGTIFFPKTAYRSIKEMFDRIRTADDHSLALRQP